MNKALFLDRDGVINVEKNYVYRIEDFEFMDGIFETLRYFQDLGFLLIVITNQAGIGRGLYTEQDFNILTEWMLEQFMQRGVTISKVYYCPTHPQFGVGEYRKDSFNRKPNPGLILKAAEEYNIDLSKSILIGDKDSDIETGVNAGIPINILLKSVSNYAQSGIATKVIRDIKELLDSDLV